MKGSQEKIIFEKDQVICREGDTDLNLFKIISGELLICKRNNHMVTPLAYLSEGEFFGEMSFFDKTQRSADVIATKRTVLIKIPQEDLIKHVPNWLNIIAINMTRKLRSMNKLVSDKGIKKQNLNLKPLSIEEQRRLFSLLSD